MLLTILKRGKFSQNNEIKMFDMNKELINSIAEYVETKKDKN